MIPKIDLRHLRARGVHPRVHGNGFIQFDLSDHERLNIWGDERIPRQSVATQIHDHIFGFCSAVLIGRLVNTIYAFEPRMYGTHQIYVCQKRDGENTTLEPVMAYGWPVERCMQIIDSTGPRFVYRMKPLVFHIAGANIPTATYMRKTRLVDPKIHLPRVLVKMGQKPDNSFSRYGHDEDLLWRIAEDTLKGV